MHKASDKSNGSGYHEQEPLWVGEVDLARPPAELVATGLTPDGVEYRFARLLVRRSGEPVGMMSVPLERGRIASDRLVAAAATTFDRTSEPTGEPHADGAHHLDRLAADRDLPAVTVVIGTRNRPDHVVACVELVFKQRYPSPVEVVIVENGASSDATERAVADAFGHDDRVRFMTETRPGLSRARNIGLAAARYPVTAFLSDDIRVDERWLLALARGFARDADVACVAGLCPPLYLDSEEQLRFESSMAWGTRYGFRPALHRFECDEDPLHPYRIGSVANGSNMAFRTDEFRRLGGFDERLGPGTRARGGEDLDAPIRVLADGSMVAFEPAAIGWHADRYDDRPFGKHMYTYGVGLTAFLAKHLLDHRFRRAVIARAGHGIPLLFDAFARRDRELSRGVRMPIRYRLAHFGGQLVGPFAYLAGRWGR